MKAETEFEIDAERRTRQQNAAGLALWSEGVEVVSANLQRLAQLPISQDQVTGVYQRVAASTLSRAVTTQRAAQDLAVREYYWQALPLARVCHEDMVACWYFAGNPRKAKTFLNQGAVIERLLQRRSGKGTTKFHIPDHEEMLQEIERRLGATFTAKHGVARAEELRSAYAWFNVMAHAGPLSAMHALSRDQEGGTLTIGAAYESRMFDVCVLAFTISLRQLLVLARDLVTAHGGKPVGSVPADYAGRVDKWLDAIASAAPKDEARP